MPFEHFALNVESPIEVAQWYCDNLNLHLVFEQKESPYMRFLADETDRVVVELYNNPKAPIMDHSVNHPLVFHVAFESTNAQADRERLETAGAVFFEEVKPGDGTHLVMMRDPWGVPLQICQRKNKLNK